MKPVLKALNLLRELEDKLNLMIEESLAEHRYGEVKELASLADGLAALIQDKPKTSSQRTTQRVDDRVMKQATAYGGKKVKEKTTTKPLPNSNKTIQAKKAQATPESQTKSNPNTGTDSEPNPSDYPRFEKDGRRLVKLGWSKKNKKAYEHRVPHETVVGFVHHLSSIVDQGQVFEVEKILPVRDSSGDEIPAYQIYVTLAWLRESGAVEKKGRDGYVLRDGSLPDGGVDKYWESLPARAI